MGGTGGGQGKNEKEERLYGDDTGGDTLTLEVDNSGGQKWGCMWGRIAESMALIENERVTWSERVRRCWVKKPEQIPD